MLLNKGLFNISVLEVFCDGFRKIGF